MFDGLTHAREHLSAEQALAILSWLTTGYGTNAAITRLVDQREIWIIPMVNPDGGEYDIAGTTYRAWRKNRQPNSGTTAVGTDINRNYGYHWACCHGSSASKSSATYHGSAAFSTPEARVIRDFMASRRVGRHPADQGRDHVPYGRRADPVAVRLHPHRCPGRHDHRGPRRPGRDRPADGRHERVHRDAVELALRHRRRRDRLGVRHRADLDVHDGAVPVAQQGQQQRAVLPARRADRPRDHAEQGRDPVLHRPCRLPVRGHRADEAELRPVLRRLRGTARVGHQPARHRHRHLGDLARGRAATRRRTPGRRGRPSPAPARW